MIPSRGLLLIARKFNNIQFVKELKKLNSGDDGLDVKEFSESCRVWRRCRFPSDWGTQPLILFDLSEMNMRLEQLEIESGITPYKLLVLS